MSLPPLHLCRILAVVSYGFVSCSLAYPARSDQSHIFLIQHTAHSRPRPLPSRKCGRHRRKWMRWLISRVSRMFVKVEKFTVFNTFPFYHIKGFRVSRRARLLGSTIEDFHSFRSYCIRKFMRSAVLKDAVSGRQFFRAEPPTYTRQKTHYNHEK